jgi:O-antigen ligase/tetratricopeptide (TPR) repeat protein
MRKVTEYSKKSCATFTINSEKSEGKRYSSAPLYLTGLLIFFSLLTSFSFDLLWDYLALGLILFIGIISFRRCDFALGEQDFRLCIPFIFLAFYSFLQAAGTLLTSSESFAANVWFPVSYDVAGSFRCGLKFVACAVLYASVILNFRRQTVKLIWIVIFTGNLFVIAGIVRYLLQLSAPENFSLFGDFFLLPGVGFGTFVNQNHFAFFALMTLGLSAGLASAGKLSAAKRIALIFAALLSWTAIILTASRGGIISSVILILALLILKGRFLRLEKKLDFRVFLITAAICLAVVFSGLIFIGQDRVIQRFVEIPAQFAELKEYEDYRRPDVWKASLVLIYEHPCFGVGFGGFRYAISRYADISGVTSPEQAHNDYLEIIACGGVVAFCAGFWALYIILRAVKFVWSTPDNSLCGSARQGILAAMCGISVHSFFDFGLQISANWIFLIVLIGIFTTSFSPHTYSEERKLISHRYSQIVLMIICLSGASLSMIAAVICDEQNHPGKFEPISRLIPLKLRETIDGANFYQSQALNVKNRGDFLRSAEYLKRATKLRPQDYKLYLLLASDYEQLQQHEKAEKYYRSALDLAPFYWETHYYLGKFYISDNRADAGIYELAAAARRNRRISSELFDLTWREKSANADEFVKSLSPPHYYENVKLAHFLLDKSEFFQAARVLCRDESLDLPTRLDFVNMLVEKRRFAAAYEAFSNNCEAGEQPATSFSDGRFERLDAENTNVFGWRIGDLPETVKISVDRKNNEKGNQLEVGFNGFADPQLMLISQTATVQQNHQYQFSFEYLTDSIVSGGLPVLKLAYKEPSGEGKTEEIQLVETNGRWGFGTHFLSPGNETEAIEIGLSRKSCPESTCPIFGKLKLKNFSLKEE